MDNCYCNVIDYLLYYLSDNDEDADPGDQSDDEISTTLSMASDAELFDSNVTLIYENEMENAYGPALQLQYLMISGLTIHPDAHLERSFLVSR